jgi:hypothetical protein
MCISDPVTFTGLALDQGAPLKYGGPVEQYSITPEYHTLKGSLTGTSYMYFSNIFDMPPEVEYCPEGAVVQ